MKKNKLMTIAFVAISSVTGQLFAQDAAGVKAGYNVKANVKCRVAATPEGCSFTFQKIEMDSKAPRDAASGQATGKRQHGVIKCYEVSSSDNSLYEVKSPRDVATGQSSGKRQHQPTTVTKEVDKSSPKLAEGVASTGTGSDDALAQGTGGGSGKVSMQDFHFVLQNSKGGKVSNLVVGDEECDIPSDLPDGEYTLIASWSWGLSQSGTMSSGSGGGSGRSASPCSVAFSLTYESGTCMAINEKGLPGDKKPKKTATNNPK